VLKNTNVHAQTQASGATEPQQLRVIEAFVAEHMAAYDGYFAVDAGGTEAIAVSLKKHGLKGKVAGGGFDLTGDTERLLRNGTIQFAIDQQPYLQGFLATIELFLHTATQGLTGTADVDTGAKFLYPNTIRPYANTQSRYEGTTTTVGIQKPG
jgi:simple sugar transport system substrate-binding protein